MNIQNPDGHSLPSQIESEGINDAVVLPADMSISAIGLLCNNILSSINVIGDFPEAERVSIGTQVSNILTMFRDHEERECAAKRKISEFKSSLRLAREQLAVLRQEVFDHSSEKGDPDDEGTRDVGFALDNDDEEGTKKPSKCKRPRKKPKDIEPTIIHHYPPDRNCTCCGNEMPSINSWTGTRMRIVPEHVEFINNVYHTCACNRSERCKENKPVPAKSQNYIMGSLSIDPAFSVEAAVQKFFEHIPTFRMERRLRCSNINVSRQALTGNVAHLSNHLEPIEAALMEHVMAGHMAHVDETPVRVQAPGKGKCETGYFWAVCRDERNWNPNAEPAVIYHYAPSRAGIVAGGLLDGAAIRFLTSDGYAGYNRLFKGDGANDGLESARCWAHARRNFYEAHLATKSPLANKIVQLIRKMYAVEKAARGLPPSEREKLRVEKSLPVLTEIRAELIKNAPKVDGLLKKAINYILKAFDSLQHFIFDGRLEIDNNPVERCIRGIALTKKNSLFVGKHEAGKVWAIYYSLIESARLNGINPRSYLNWVVNQIETNKGDVDWHKLLPWHCPVWRIEG